MKLMRSHRALLITVALVLTTALSSCISVAMPWSDVFGGVRFMSFANTSAHEILVGKNNFTSAAKSHIEWVTNPPEDTDPDRNYFSVSLDGDGVLTATLSNSINNWTVSRGGFEDIVAAFKDASWGIMQMIITAETATEIEATDLNLGTGPLAGTYEAIDGGTVCYELSKPTGGEPFSFGVSGYITLYGEFSESDPDASMVEFLFGDPEEAVDEGPSGKLAVTVVKSDRGDVGGIPVKFGGDLGASLKTNASGKVSVSGLYAGTYAVNASAEGYTSDGPKDIVLDSDADEGSAKITLTPVPPPPAPPGPGAIEGKVKNGATGQNLPGALVKLRDASDTILGMAVSGLEGEFSFPGLAPGAYTVRATLDGYDPAIELAEVANDATTIVEAIMSAVIVIVEPPTPPAEPPAGEGTLPTTGASLLAIAALGVASVAAGYGIRRKR